MNYTLPQEYDAEIFSKAVQFMYTGSYEDEDHPNYEMAEPEGTWNMSVEEVQAGLQLSGEAVATGDIMDAGHDEDEDEDDEDCDMDVDNDDEREEANEDGSDDDDGEEELDEDEDESDDDDSTIDEEGQDDDDTLMEELGANPPGYHDDLPNAMSTSVKVFAMADYFGISALKLLAKKRFYRSVECRLLTPDFAVCVDEMYSRTDGADLSLLKEIVVVFVHLIYGTADAGHLLPIMEKHAELANAVLKYYVAAQKAITAREGDRMAY